MGYVPAPAPRVTEYVAQAKQCPCCGTVTEGGLPAHVRARASFGPEASAQAANLIAGHHIPVYRATLVLCQLAGLTVSAGWMAGIRGKAAALIGASGFADRVRELLRDAPAVHADETPARAAGGMRYVHLACTAYLTLMHTGDRSADAIDAGHVLPGYAGIIVRDGYSGYSHLTGALHAWCGAHLLRDLKDLYDFEPGKQDWASQMAALLIEARGAARDARAAPQDAEQQPVDERAEAADAGEHADHAVAAFSTQGMACSLADRSSPRIRGRSALGATAPFPRPCRLRRGQSALTSLLCPRRRAHADDRRPRGAVPTRP